MKKNGFFFATRPRALLAGALRERHCQGDRADVHRFRTRKQVDLDGDGGRVCSIPGEDAADPGGALRRGRNSGPADVRLARLAREGRVETGACLLLLFCGREKRNGEFFPSLLQKKTLNKKNQKKTIKLSPTYPVAASFGTNE